MLDLVKKIVATAPGPDHVRTMKPEPFNQRVSKEERQTGVLKPKPLKVKGGGMARTIFVIGAKQVVALLGGFVPGRRTQRGSHSIQWSWNTCVRSSELDSILHAKYVHEEEHEGLYHFLVPAMDAPDLVVLLALLLDLLIQLIDLLALHLDGRLELCHRLALHLSTASWSFVTVPPCISTVSWSCAIAACTKLLSKLSVLRILPITSLVSRVSLPRYLEATNTLSYERVILASFCSVLKDGLDLVAASQAHAARHAHGVRLRDDSKEGGKCGRAYPAILYVGQALDTIRTNMNACERSIEIGSPQRTNSPFTLVMPVSRYKEQDDIVEHRGSPVQERAVVAGGRVQLDEVGCKK